jgi:hypothetical protein
LTEELNHFNSFTTIPRRLTQHEVKDHPKSREILCQMYKMNKLQLQKQVLDMSLSVMNIWCKNFQRMIWEQIMIMNHDASPEMNMMHIVFTKAVSEGILVDQNSSGFYTLCQVRIPLIEIFPASLKPVKFGLVDKKSRRIREGSSIMKRVVETMCVISTRKMKTIISRTHFKVEEVPLLLYKHTDDNKYRLKIEFQPPLAGPYAKHITLKMEFLLWYLNMCHKQFILLQIEKGMNWVGKASEQFQDWLYEVIFAEKNDNQFPIFGDLNSEENDWRSVTFDEVQKYIINEYLSQSDSHRKVVQVSLALICYWYQTFHPDSFFKQEQEYWKTMIESLGIMLNTTGRYSLKAFDPDGNFIDK